MKGSWAMLLPLVKSPLYAAFLLNFGGLRSLTMPYLE